MWRAGCTFRECRCACFVAGARVPGKPCAVCGHGQCWHARAEHPFTSPRSPARRPVYLRYAWAVAVPPPPHVPALPDY